MDFLIADTFTDSLARLTGEEQKAVKTTAFDLQLNPANPGSSFHKLDKAKDKNFWYVRASRDIRLIVHKTQGSLLLCYVDHHDKAYDWAERRKLETHPKTGAAQLVEIRETVQQILVPTYVEVETPKPAVAKQPLFANQSDDDLLGYGVPAEWLNQPVNLRVGGGEPVLSISCRHSLKKLFPSSQISSSLRNLFTSFALTTNTVRICRPRRSSAMPAISDWHWLRLSPKSSLAR